MTLDSQIMAEALHVGRSGISMAGPFDFSVRPGECLLVTGANGSGKSTLLRTLAGLLAPCGGSLSMPQGRRLYLPQLTDDSLDMPLSVHDVIRTTLSSGSRDRRRVTDACERVGLTSACLTRPWRRLSGGERQRVNWIRFLMSDATVALLDEPTSALDHAAERQIIGVCGDHLVESSLHLVVVTHSPEAWKLVPQQRIHLGADSSNRVVT